MNSKFLTAEWRKLAIANYIIDPAILKQFIPYKTEIDLWNGKCYVSLVGFRFLNTRLKGFYIPLHRNFEEVNLRFYVRFKDGSGWKRGVTFIKEIVPKPALALIANSIYKEKYVTMPMRHKWSVSGSLLSVQYSWKHKNYWHKILLQAETPATEILQGSEEEFITEHYWGYTPLTYHSCSEYQVEHPRWNVYKVNEYAIDVKFDELYGSNFAMLNILKPESVMLAEGSEISVLGKRFIK